MELSDIDKKFDMQSVIWIGADLNLFSFPESYAEPIPIFLDFRNSFHRATMVIDRSVSMKDIQMLKFQYEVKQSGSLYTISRDIPESALVKRIHDLVNTHAASIVAIYLEKKVLKIKIKFHHSVDREISDHLLSMALQYEDFHIEYLGPSAGIKEDILELNRMFSLTSLSFSIDEDTSTQNTLARFPAGTVFELQNKAGSHMAILAYPDEMTDVPQGVLEISREDSIYETEYSHPALDIIRSEAYARGVVRYNYFGKMKDGRLKVRILLLKSHLTAYLSILEKIAREKGQWNIVLDGVSSVNDSTFLDF